MSWSTLKRLLCWCLIGDQGFGVLFRAENDSAKTGFNSISEFFVLIIICTFDITFVSCVGIIL